jgi:hypothetical protein
MSKELAVPTIDLSKVFSVIENGKLLLIDKTSGEVVASSGEQDAIRNRGQFSYSIAWREAILAQIFDGKTLYEIGKMEGYPSYGYILRWRLQHPDFDEDVNKARKMLAEKYHDEAIDQAMNHSEEISDAKDKIKLKVDTLKWAAERNDPAKFGGSTKILGDKNNPIGMYVLSTGIERGEKLASIDDIKD